MIQLGRYELFEAVARGGMASVHLGRLLGDDGFVRVVAIKRLHPQFASDPEFVSMLRDEARLASRIRHPNVVAVTDIVSESGELSLVMDYVPGESLSRLMRSARVPPAIASSLMLGVLAGLHAAHEARDEAGSALDLVHRDVSPHNVLVGTDGLAHVIDFGIAKARGRSTMTREGDLKGKLAYMAPEQIRRGPVTRAADIYAAAVTLWELLAGRRLFDADNEASLVVQVLTGASEPPSRVAGALPAGVDDVVMRGLAPEPTRRYPSARAMADALERALAPASHAEVALWLETHAHDALAARARAMEAAERGHGLAIALPAREPSPIGYATRHRAKRLAVVGLGLLVVGASVGGVLAFARTRPNVVELAPSPSPSILVDVDAAAAAPLPATAVVAPSDPPAPSLGSASASASAPAPPRAHPRAPRAPECDPPYTTLANGHKVFKRACL